jgi:hypothetical protein
MLLPALIVGGLLTVPIIHAPPRAARQCEFMADALPMWFSRVGKATMGCPQDFTVPVGWDRPERLVRPLAPAPQRLQPK